MEADADCNPFLAAVTLNGQHGEARDTNIEQDLRAEPYNSLQCNLRQ